MPAGGCSRGGCEGACRAHHGADLEASRGRSKSAASAGVGMAAAGHAQAWARMRSNVLYRTDYTLAGDDQQ